MLRLTLDVLEGELAVARAAPGVGVPDWLEWDGEPLVSVTRTGDELSVVAPSSMIPSAAHAERGWRALRVRGVLDFAMTGVLASLSTALASASQSVFAISTFDTDYLLVREASLPDAIRALAVEHIVHASREGSGGSREL